MESITISDLSRMLLAIDHECALRVKELKLEANEEYNHVKSELIIKYENDLKRQFAEDLKEIKRKQQREESKLKQRYKLKTEEQKAQIFESIIQGVRENVQKRCLDLSIIKTILRKPSFDELVVFVDERDVQETKKTLDENGKNYTLKPMPVEGMGGIIVCSKNGNEIWDSSFETRLNIFVEKYADRIGQVIFRQ